MSTSSASDLEAALAGIDPDIRTRLVESYLSVKEAFAEGQYDACGLRAGKFCEVVLRLLQQELTGAHVPFGTKLGVFTDEARKLEKLPKTCGPESLRLIIPRSIDYVYTLRNKRAIGHVGGDIDANETDAALCVRALDWCMAELIRVFHALSLEEAQELIDSLAVRQLPMIWQVGGIKRVLMTGLPLKEQTLCLLYSDPHTAVTVEELVEWVDVKRVSDYRTRVLLPLHKARLIEYDRANETVVLSPVGASAAETIIKAGLSA